MKLKPVFEAIAKDYPDIKFVKVNVEQNYPRFTDLKKKAIAEYYRTKRFNLDIIKYFSRSL